MAIKTIEYKISVSGITPSVEQSAGMQGDHCVTKISISIDDELYSLIMRNYENSNLLYHFDVYYGEGGIWQSEVKVLEQNIGLMLEERHTRHGGKITVYLVITALSQDNQTEMELYSFPCVLRFKSRPDGTYQDIENLESVASLAENARLNAETAVSASTSAQSAESSARHLAAEVEQKLANGEFDGQDGVSVTHKFDGTVLTVTSASGTSSVDLKGEKGDTGEQGPKGEKGDNGEITNLDQTYSPTSENAQSGKAVAEAINTVYDDFGTAIDVWYTLHIGNDGIYILPLTMIQAIEAANINLLSFNGKVVVDVSGSLDLHAIGFVINKKYRIEIRNKQVVSIKSFDEIVDKNYNPLSDNAQSGKAVSEALQGYVEKVKGNGHTYQVYAVGNTYDEYNDITLTVEDNEQFEADFHYGQIPSRQANGNIMTNTPVKNLDCANKKYVDDAVANLSGLKVVIVSALPESGESATLYFVPTTYNQGQNLYDEYIYTNGAWEKIGSAAVEVDLIDYVKKTDIATSDTAGLVKVSDTYALSVNTSGSLLCDIYTLTEYNYKPNAAFVSKGTLNNVLAEKLGDIETLLGGI